MSKGKFLRTLTVLMAMLVTVALAACTGAPGATGSAGASAPAADTSEMYAMTILTAGDQPPDQQTVLDAVKAATKNTLNIDLTVKYFPWADYIEKVRMMSAAKEKFDICLTFSGVAQEAYNRKEMIPLDDLLNQYGPNLKSKITQSNWVWALGPDGKTIAIPAQYAKDGVYYMVVLRKDLRLKYNCPEIVDMDTLGQFLDAVAKNEPNITPLLGGSIGGPVIMDNLKKFDPNIDIGYQGQGYSIGFWTTTGADAYKVKNWYADERAKNFIYWGEQAMNRKWYAKDLNAGENGYDQTALASGKVACLQMDYYNYNTIYNNAKESNPSFELEWAMVNKGIAMAPDVANNFAQVSATSAKPERAVMFLDWIQASQDNYDLWFYGIKDKHYKLSDKGEVVYPEGSVSTALPYSPTPWWFRNFLMDRSISTDCDMTKTAQQYYKDQKVLDVPNTASFTFDIKNVDLQITQVNSVIQEKWNDISNGVLQGDAEYQAFLKALDDAGMQDILNEMQKQLDAWREAHK